VLVDTAEHNMSLHDSGGSIDIICKSLLIDVVGVSFEQIAWTDEQPDSTAISTSAETWQNAALPLGPATVDGTTKLATRATFRLLCQKEPTVVASRSTHLLSVFFCEFVLLHSYHLPTRTFPPYGTT
jgi:hypothetical protein